MATVTPALSAVPLSQLLAELDRRFLGSPPSAPAPSPQAPPVPTAKKSAPPAAGARSPAKPKRETPVPPQSVQAPVPVAKKPGPAVKVAASRKSTKSKSSKPAVSPQVAPVADGGGAGTKWSPEGIKSLRSALKMTQVEFAEALGVNAVSVYGYETRDRKGNPRQSPRRENILARLEGLRARVDKKKAKKK